VRRPSRGELTHVTRWSPRFFQNALITRKSHQTEQSDLREESWLTRAEVAKLFGVSTSTVTRWARQRRLTVIRTPGGHYRFPARETRDMVASLTGPAAGVRR
jgi:excisionase family DNA binding protein